MVRALRTLGILAMISAGVVFVLCGARLSQGAPEIGRNLSLPILEKFSQAGDLGEKSSQETLSPLVKQAEGFALYLNPPQPPKPRKAPVPKHSLKQTTLAVRAGELKPKFTLVATSYYRSRPEESMALVSEPGKEPRWVKQGACLSHFVVEEVERGMIVYRDGDRLVEMAINTKVPVRTKQAKQTMLAADQTKTSPSRPRPSSHCTIFLAIGPFPSKRTLEGKFYASLLGKSIEPECRLWVRSGPKRPRLRLPVWSESSHKHPAP